MFRNRTLYRPVGENELMLIIESEMKKFPPRLFWQPIFYPVLTSLYAEEIAERWNMRDPNSNEAGFVTEFDIPLDYFSQFEVQTVGLDHHQELWVPADQLDEFNAMIIDGIKVTKAFVGKQFVIPDQIKSVLG